MVSSFRGNLIVSSLQKNPLLNGLCLSVSIANGSPTSRRQMREGDRQTKRETTNRSVKKVMGQYFPSLSCQDPVSCSCGLASTYATRWESRRGASFAFLTRSSVFAITMPLLPNTHSVPQEKKKKTSENRCY